MSYNNALLLLGSNLGNPIENLEKAISAIESCCGTVVKRSKLLKTKPVEFGSNNYFCNIAMSINTHCSPVQLLSVLKRIERNMGREQDSSDLGGYHDRIIDIDIVKFNGISFRSEKLEIPHKKHLFKRDFSIELIKEINEH